MKKIITLGLTIVMLGSLCMTTWGSTIGVNVNKGASASVEKTDFDQDAVLLKGNYGVTNKLLLWLGYSTETAKNSDDATARFGLRYELVRNFAGILEYSANDGLDELNLGLRAKTTLAKPLALVGEAKYQYFTPDKKDSYSGYSLTAQIEYSFSQLLTSNLGVTTSTDDRKGSEDKTNFIAGLELYPTNRLTWWADYTLDQDTDDDTIGAGIEFKF